MTKAQSLGITEFPYTERNAKNRVTYYETESGYWEKCEYDAAGNHIRYEDSSKTWFILEYDRQGRETSYTDSDGGWYKRKYSESGRMIHEENQHGIFLV
jgi:YD repeat-containing protein